MRLDYLDLMDAGSSSISSGRGTETLDEPAPNLNYVSVFITHFLCSPAENSGKLKELYLDLGLSLRELADFTEGAWSKTSIIEALQIHKIKKELAFKSSRPPYGMQLVKGELIPDEKEQKVIQLILKLKEEGKSLRAIARFLNDKKIKSKTGGQWEKTVVSTIIKREEKRKV